MDATDSAASGTIQTPSRASSELLQFTLMDQTPDFLVYEHALLDGRAVIAVHVADRDRMLAAAAVLERHGAHFLNYFGRLSTEEVSMWRGEEAGDPRRAPALTQWRDTRFAGGRPGKATAGESTGWEAS